MWRQCKRAHHHKYIEGIRPKVKGRPLQFGSLVHSMLEAYAEGDDPFEVLDNLPDHQKKMFASERELYGDLIEDVRLIMTEYFEYWPEDSVKFIRRKKRSAEHWFEVEVAKDIVAIGKIDAKVKSKGLDWLYEHKTFTNLPSEDHRWRDLQSILYIHIMRLMGWGDAEGTLWDYIHSKPPTKPTLLKNGTLSKKKLRTLPSRLIATIEEHGLKAKDYKAMVESAKGMRGEWFKRIYTPIKRHAVDIVVSDFIESAREMGELQEKKRSMSIGRHCDWCDYESLCRAELTGGDVDYVKEKEFFVSKKGDWRN